jgi:hypothetical protein
MHAPCHVCNVLLGTSAGNCHQDRCGSCHTFCTCTLHSCMPLVGPSRAVLTTARHQSHPLATCSYIIQKAHLKTACLHTADSCSITHSSSSMRAGGCNAELLQPPASMLRCCRRTQVVTDVSQHIAGHQYPPSSRAHLQLLIQTHDHRTSPPDSSCCLILSPVPHRHWLLLLLLICCASCCNLPGSTLHLLAAPASPCCCLAAGCLLCCAARPTSPRPAAAARGSPAGPRCGGPGHQSRGGAAPPWPVRGGGIGAEGGIGM